MKLSKLFSLFALCSTAILASAVASDGSWMTNYTAAKEKAAAEGKLLLLDFTGSDWCPPCQYLEKQVFSQDAFLDYAKDTMVLMKVDFPRRSSLPAALAAQNEELAIRYQIEGFPTVMIFSSEGELLDSKIGIHGHMNSAASFVKYVKKYTGSSM